MNGTGNEEQADAAAERQRVLAAKAVARKRQKREARVAAGRCPLCGKLALAGETRCGRCLESQRVRNRELAARRKAAREKTRRESGPRVCPQCGGGDFWKRGFQDGRQRLLCKACGRYSYGDGLLVAKPDFSCPYCKGRCRKAGKTRGKFPRQIYRCLMCGRTNINLWPGDAPSPGGPFPHSVKFQLNKAAQIGLEAYLQAKGMSAVQAIRDIFIQAGQKPLGFVSSAPRRYSAGYGSRDDGWDEENDGDAGVVYSAALPAPVQEPIPSGGVRLPDLRAEATGKFARQTGRAWRCPTVLVAWRLSVKLNDAALQGLLATMKRRGMNHQEAARALCAEAKA